MITNATFLSDDSSEHHLTTGKDSAEESNYKTGEFSNGTMKFFSKGKTITYNKNVASLILICICTFLVIVTVLAVVSFVELRKCEKRVESLDVVPNTCSYSDEATRVGLRNFLDRVRDEYFNVCPEDIAWHPDSTVDMVRTKFQIHDPKPEAVKRVSDRAELLYREAVNMKPDLAKLKPREHKSYLQMKHFLRFSFGKPAAMYKSGLWMLGPSSFCEESICNLGSHIHNSFDVLRPKDEQDVGKIVDHFEHINQSVSDYIDVLKMGITKGMVRTRKECLAGYQTFSSLHPMIKRKGPSGIIEERYGKQFFRPEFYERLTKEMNDLYLTKHGVNVTQYITTKVKELVGESIHSLLTYLSGEYYDACRPDNIGPGGLSALPIDVIYYNESVVPGSKTDPFLPICDDGSKCRLSGSEAYDMILGYYTTKDIHPSDVHEMGWENIHRLYPQMVEIAKKVTQLDSEEDAVKSFRENILSNLTLSYFNAEPIPANQSSGPAFTKCTSDESAKLYCPKRWEAMMSWFEYANMAMSIHDGNIVDFFFFTGQQKTTPSCPVQLRVDYNPSSGAQSYWESNHNCTTPSKYYIPFFLENLGPKYSEYTVNAHEARPGHHTQIQGMLENFLESCDGPEKFLHLFTHYTAFTEGWALYAENPLVSEETNVYEDNLMQKYGMLKWQMWRAIRLVVDTGLHYKGYSREKSLQLFDKYAWDNTDLGRKEITRYQSNPGQATAYMIGQLDIWRLRNHTKKHLQNMFSLREFHLQTISQGASPLAYLESHINKYIACKMDVLQQYCDIVLNPPNYARTNRPRNPRRARKDSELKIESPRRRRHYL